MALESLTQLGVGGNIAALPAVLKELQGLRFAVLTGAAANTKINVAPLRMVDTLVAAILFTTGTPSDILNTITIEDVRASGTVTLGSVVDGNTVTINGKVYTFKTTVTDVNSLQVALGASATEAAANLVKKLNYVEGNGPIFASSASNVVTVRARAEGTGGNSIALVAGTNSSVSGSTLAGGTATGGIKSSTDTSSKQIVLVWFDKA